MNTFSDTQLGRFYLGECLEIMATFPDRVFDMVLCDLPYGTTACKWDSVIPFELLWAQYRRICKPDSAIVLFGSQPFTTSLIGSNLKDYKCVWVWDKTKAGNFAIAKFQPLRVTEDIVVFSFGKCPYFPQMVESKLENRRPRSLVSVVKDNSTQGIKGVFKNVGHPESLRFPKNLLTFPSTTGELNNKVRVHPTQKPVALFEYLIKTYTNPRALVLDNCAGSGTTAVACENTNRRWVCIEKEAEYYHKALVRLPIDKTEEIA